MKKLYSLILAVVAVASVYSCSDKDFKDKYYDPSKTTSVTCDKLMTGAFMAGNGYTFNAYWRMYTWDYCFGKLAQTIGVNMNSGSMYYIQDGYANDRWNSFYDILRQYRVMQKQYNSETEAQQAEDRIFLALTEVFLYDHLSQIVDLFGPVPFEEACYIGLTGNLASSYPKYDSDVELYKMMLTNLDALYTEIGNLANSISAATAATLVAQDYLNNGDLAKWQSYANALLLRLGVHVSAQGSLTTEGKQAVSKAAGRALPTNWENSIKAVSDFDGFNYYENFRDGWKDINAPASQVIIDAFQVTGADDPRLAVVYYPNEAGEYHGMNTSETADEQDGHNTYTDYTDRYYSQLNHYTFAYNNLFVSPVFSAAEAWFLLAEAYQQGYAAGNANEAFKKAIAASVEQLFAENVYSDQSKAAGNGEYSKKFEVSDIPSAADCATLADNIWGAYTNKLEAIMCQKHAHFGITQATQAWTDIRRTGYPKLTYPTDNGAGATVKNIVNRVKYPNTEAKNNTANYEANKANVDGDSADFVLFWAKSLK